MQRSQYLECRRLEIIWVQQAMVSKIFCSDNCIHYKFSIIDTLVSLAPTLAPWSGRCGPLIGCSFSMPASDWLIGGWDAPPGQLGAPSLSNWLCKLRKIIHPNVITDDSSSLWAEHDSLAETQACEGRDLGTHSWKHKVALGDIDLAIRTRNHN